ncbi:MAG: CDP-alcohol phosphatidyltransferase family protein, partial [Nannocystaceae bacterium]
VVFKAMEGKFEEAGWLIVLCVLLDKLDGTAARALRASSRFGMQLDSLVDFLAFGISPGLTVFMVIRLDESGVMDFWRSSHAAEWSMRAMVGGYILCSALRLAKFNVLSEDAGEDGARVFWGMPTTFAGGMLGLILLIGLQHDIPLLLGALPPICFGFGWLMLSNLRIPKVAPRSSQVAQILQALSLAVCYLCGLLRIFPEVLLTITFTYASIGIIWGIRHRREFIPPHKQTSTTSPPPDLHGADES